MVKVLELQPQHQSLQGKSLDMQIFGLSKDLKSEIVSHSVLSLQTTIFCRYILLPREQPVLQAEGV